MVLPIKDRVLNLRAPGADVTRWASAALSEKMALSDWIRRACDTRAETVETLAALSKKKRSAK